MVLTPLLSTIVHISRVIDAVRPQPATVSRCGMIYMEPSQLGWEPLVASWMNTLPEALRGSDHGPLVLELFRWLLPPALRVLRKQCRVRVHVDLLFIGLSFEDLRFKELYLSRTHTGYMQ